MLVAVSTRLVPSARLSSIRAMFLGEVISSWELWSIRVHQLSGRTSAIESARTSGGCPACKTIGNVGGIAMSGNACTKIVSAYGA